MLFTYTDGSKVEADVISTENDWYDELHAAWYDQSHTYQRLYDESAEQDTEGLMHWEDAQLFALEHHVEMVPMTNEEGIEYLVAVRLIKSEAGNKVPDDRGYFALEMDTTGMVPILELLMGLGY